MMSLITYFAVTRCAGGCKPSRIKTRRRLIRINGVRLIVFFVVAALTSQREVVGVGRAAQRFGNDVFVGMSMRGVRIRADTVLATAERAFGDQPLQVQLISSRRATSKASA